MRLPRVGCCRYIQSAEHLLLLLRRARLCAKGDGGARRANPTVVIRCCRDANTVYRQ